MKRPPYRKLGNGVPNPVVCGRRFCPGCGRWRHIVDFTVENRRHEVLSFRHCRCCAHRLNVKVWSEMPEEVKERRREYERIWREQRRRRAGLPVRPRARHGDNARSFLPREPLAAELLRWYEAQRDDVFHSRGNHEGNRRPASGYAAGWDGLAELSGVPARSIARIVRGESRRVTLDVADRLAVAMDTPLSLIYPPDEDEEAA